RRAPRRSPCPRRAAGFRHRDLDAGRTRKTLSARRGCQGDGLYAQALGRLRALPRRWAGLSDQQCGRARAARHRPRPQVMAVRRLRPRRRACRRDVHADPDREGERHRSAGLARRCPRPHQRSQYPKTRSAPALELEDNLSQTRRMKRSSHSDLSCADFPAVLTVRLRSGEPPSPGRNGERHFHGEQRSNETHSSTTDPEAKLAKKGKGKEAKLAYTGNVMTENRNGFVVEAELRQVSGTVERETAKDMIVRYSPGAKRITVGADKGFDTADFVSDMRDFNVTPHVAQNTTNRLSAIDGRTVRHCGYEVSQQKRKRVEEPFGWGKTIGGLARPMLRGGKKLDFKFTLTMAAYDLIKLPRLIGATA